MLFVHNLPHSKFLESEQGEAEEDLRLHIPRQKLTIYYRSRGALFRVGALLG